MENAAFERPTPVPTPTSQPFWDALADDRVIIQHCDDCAAWVFYPRSHCSHCLSNQLTWQEVSGRGEIYTFTIARRPTAPHFADNAPQFIAVIQLDEGVRMNSVIVNVTEEQLKVGLEVKPVFSKHLDGHTLLYFEPA